MVDLIAIVYYVQNKSPPFAIKGKEVIMSPDQNVVHRKVVVPWYDTEAVCFFTIFVLFLIFLFAIIGISVASEEPDFHRHVWVPIILLILSSGVMVSITIRLVRRYVTRFQNRYLKEFSHNPLE